MQEQKHYLFNFIFLKELDLSILGKAFGSVIDTVLYSFILIIFSH